MLTTLGALAVRHGRARATFPVPFRVWSNQSPRLCFNATATTPNAIPLSPFSTATRSNPNTESKSSCPSRSTFLLTNRCRPSSIPNSTTFSTTSTTTQSTAAPAAEENSDEKQTLKAKTENADGAKEEPKQKDFWEEDRDNLRAFVRERRSSDPTVLLAGEITTKAERMAWVELRRHLTWRQWMVSSSIYFRLNLRRSFMNGHIARLLTGLAVWAAASELLHDFFHEVEVGGWMEWIG